MSYVQRIQVSLGLIQLENYYKLTLIVPQTCLLWNKRNFIRIVTKYEQNQNLCSKESQIA